MDATSRYKLASATDGAVAVIGIGCRYPGGVTDAASYWSLLMRGDTGIVEIPADRWDKDIFYSPEPDTRGKMRTRWGGFLAEDVFAFDPAFFDMSPREVMSMDPQQRLLLQVAYEAMQDAGARICDLQAEKTGVFIGMSTNDFNQRQVDGTRTDIFAGTGSAYSIAANRISHRFDLNGPSLTIDTACSSSLVAIDSAINSIVSGNCTLALAGGVNCMFDPRPFIAFSTANMLSPTGTISTFDSRANGFVRGEGCGLVLLKLLDRAIADGDRVYGVVRQTAVNQDGHTKTITSPSGEAQEEMLRALVSRSGVDPWDVGYIEAHGTGTPVGDPIEATAIGRVFGAGRAVPAWVGSFKPNLGHLESAAGAAGFIKALLAVHHGVVPPNRNFENPNPSIPFDALGIRVPTAASEFPTDPGRPRMAVVNSFGFGGTNASALIEEWRPAAQDAEQANVATAPQVQDGRPLMVPLSGGGSAGLKLWAGKLAEECEGGALKGETAHAVARALWLRDHLPERAALLVRPGTDDLPLALKALAEGRNLDEAPEGPAIITGRAAAQPLLGFAFSGQGGQWWGMSRQLLIGEPLYRRTVECVDEALRPLTGWSLIEEMMQDESTSRINEADRTQGAIFANQVGLYALWTARGLKPDLLFGHSFGEIAVAHVSGMIDLGTAARIIAARGRIPQHSSKRGAMAAIGLTAEQLTPFLPEDGSAVLGAFNGPVSQTVTGVETSVVELMEKVSAEYPDALVRRLNMSFAWHSPLLDECEIAFRNEVGEVKWRNPNVPVVSTVTGMLLSCFDLDYLWENLRQPVSFTKAVRFCLDYGIDTFLELGPHRTVTPLINGISQDADRTVSVVSSLDRKQDDFWSMARAEAQLFTRGCGLSAPEAALPADRRKLPRMPWANQHLDQLSPQSRSFLFEGPRHVLLGKRDPGPDPQWTSELLLPNAKFLSDHKVNGDCLFPAVGYLEVMAAALRDHFGHGPVELRDFRIHDALSLAPDDIVELRTHLEPRSGRIRIHTFHRGAGDGWRLRAEAYGWRHDFELPKGSEIPLQPADAQRIEASDFYAVARRFGLEYGPFFRPVHKVWRIGDGHFRGWIECGKDSLTADYYAFPGLFDGILQTSILAAAPEAFWVERDVGAIPSGGVFFPVGAKRVLMKRPFGTSVWAEARVAAGEERSYDFFACDESGDGIVAIEGLQTRTLAAAEDEKESPGEVYRETFVRVVLPPEGNSPERRNWLVFADGSAAGSLSVMLKARHAIVELASLDPLQSFDADAVAACITSFCERVGGPAGVLFAVSGGAALLCDDASGEDLLRVTQSISEALVVLAKGLHALQSGPLRPKLVVVTEMARHLPEDGEMGLASVARAAAVGIVRTIANELPEFRTLLIDADQQAMATGSELAQLVICDGAEPEYILRKENLYGVRLEKLTLTGLEPAKRFLSATDEAENFRVTMSTPGLIDNIRLRETAYPVPKVLEVVVEVAAVGLNFRDVMAATSILPDELAGEAAFWNNLGLEFSGTVRQVGEGVTDFRPGDRVMGMGKGFLRRYAIARVESLMRVPETIDLASAASMPVAYLTAHYSLIHVGRLEEGERALIHLASGGVGLAAIEVCRYAGAEIFATAGTEDKRVYLSGLGINHVMNSRTLEFAREVKAVTGGRGVDVVLNALSGAGIDKSLECLAPCGRMVEIGKRDLADDKPIGLKSLYWNNSYSVIDLSTLPAERPKQMRKLTAEVEALIAKGVYPPLNNTRFPVTKAAEALRTLAKARHIGKVIVTLDEPELMVEQDLSRPIGFRREAAYLVTGGLKGFGAQIGCWIAERGAGKVILANRAGKPDAAAGELIAAMEARGTIVECAALDVMDAKAVAALVAGNAAGSHPLRGIFHAAAVIEDAFITQLDRERLARVLGPKVAGAQNLENAARQAGVKLDHFVFFSSIAQMIGSAGQANYTAANGVLNAFADYRQSRGENANAVAWGMIGGSGFVARSEAVGNYLESMGIKAVADTDAAHALGSLMRSTATYAAFAKVEWPALMRAFPSIASNPKVKPVLARGEGGQSRIQAELRGLPRSEWESVLDLLIRDEVARVLKADVSTIALDKKLTELGLDSLSSFELKNRVEALVEVSIPVARFLQAPTVSGLSRLVAASLEAKFKAGELAQRDAATGGDGADGRGEAGFRPLTRQTEALRRGGLPMTSPLAAADMVMRLDSGSTLGVDTISERLSRMAVVHDALRLACVEQPDGSLTLEFAEAPALMDDQADLVLPGALWRFERLEGDEGQARIVVKAHRAAADAISVERVLRQLIGEEDVPATALPFREAAQRLEDREDSPERINDLAYWRELLNHAPPLASLSRRRRAAAPAGFGINRGDVLVHWGDTAGAPVSAGEAQLLAAYAEALASLLGEEDVLIERHRRKGWTDLSAMVGPVTSSHPVIIKDAARCSLEQVETLIAQGEKHAATDTAVLEATLSAQLIAAGASLRQFGFHFGGNELKELDPVPLTGHEVLLIITPRPTGLFMRIVVDSEVVPEHFGPALSTKILACLSRRLGSSHALRFTSNLASSKRSLSRSKNLPSIAQRSASAERDYCLLPLTISQSGLLAALGLPTTNDEFRRNWLVSRALRFTPQLDLPRLSAMLSELRNRHEALRTRFVRRDDGAHQALLLARAPSQDIVVETFSDLPAAEDRARALIDIPIDPLKEDLLQVRVLRVSTSSDIVVIKGHHLVLDGYSAGMLIEELVQLFLGMSLPPVEITTEEFIESIDLSHDPHALAHRDAMLDRIYANPAPQLPAVYDRPELRHNQTAGVPSKALSFIAPPVDLAGLAERCRSAGTTISTMLVAALGQVLARRSGMEEAVVAAFVARRHDARTRNYANWVATECLMKIPGDASALEVAALGVGRSLEAFHRSAPMHDVHWGGPWRQRIVDYGSYSSNFFAGMLTGFRGGAGALSSYLWQGTTETELDFGFLKMGTVPGTEYRRTLASDIDLRLFDAEGGAGFSFTYNTAAFAEDTAREIFREVLQRLGFPEAVIG